MYLICPVCNQTATFKQYFEEIYQRSAPVINSGNGLEVDFEKTELVQTCLMEDDPENVICNSCYNDVDIREIKIVQDLS